MELFTIYASHSHQNHPVLEFANSRLPSKIRGRFSFHNVRLAEPAIRSHLSVGDSNHARKFHSLDVPMSSPQLRKGGFSRRASRAQGGSLWGNPASPRENQFRWVRKRKASVVYGHRLLSFLQEVGFRILGTGTTPSDAFLSTSGPMSRPLPSSGFLSHSPS
ncbi:hypothetical protein K438DRAFT_697431 [Mycena galopus ATCC 62051]|nr:hypothetical protein K438DRAFT_697431 [Mycena galopus ATCC 62051]